MGRRYIGLLLGSCLVAAATAMAAEPEPRPIPGITAPDRAPRACVDCHVNRPQDNRDFRLSTHLRELTGRVDPGLLAKAKAATPDPAALKGRHPAVGSFVFQDVPARCAGCHTATATRTPPLAPLMHMIHLTGGKENHFLTVFGGECTLCHKLDRGKGTWSVPSAAER